MDLTRTEADDMKPRELRGEPIESHLFYSLFEID